MTEKRIGECRADVQYIHIDEEGWFRVISYSKDHFGTVYEGSDMEDACTLTFEELADRDDVEFYTLTKIKED